MYYYKICNLDTRITNPDQRLTEDSNLWADNLASMYLSTTKPIFDLFMFAFKLKELLGWAGPGSILTFYFFSGLIIKTLTPNFGKLIAIEQTIEGEYRAKHTDLLNHSEEIAFYNGSEWEKLKINQKLKELLNHRKFVQYKQFLINIYRYVIIKYGAVSLGYTVVGLPVFGSGREEYLKSVNNDTGLITNDYVRNSFLLINFAKAIGKLLMSTRDMQKLAGYTTLINELNDVLGDLTRGKYTRSMVVS